MPPAPNAAGTAPLRDSLAHAGVEPLRTARSCATHEGHGVLWLLLHTVLQQVARVMATVKYKQGEISYLHMLQLLLQLSQLPRLGI